MSIKVSRDYIDESLKNLYTLLGIRESLPPKRVYEKFDGTINGINKANKIIAEHIKITNPVFVKFGRINTFSLTNKEKPSFIPAQITIPFELPLYGDSSLRNIPITITLDEDLKNKSRQVIAAILAHENTHLILRILRYSGNYEEIDTELAAIVLGLGQLIKRGTVHIDYSFFSSEYRIETHGYLEEESFNYAYKKTRNFYNSYNKHYSDILERIKNLKSFIKKSEKIYNVFKENLDWINQNLNSIKIKPNDSQRFVEMQNFIFQQINFDTVLTQRNKMLNELYKTISEKKIYQPTDEYQFITEVNTTLDNEFKKIRENYNSLKQWLKIQVKYIKFIQKFFNIVTLIKN